MQVPGHGRISHHFKDLQQIGESRLSARSIKMKYFALWSDRVADGRASRLSELVGAQARPNATLRYPGVLVATNRDLAAGIDKGTFRQDLYYRLKVVELHVPPLRDRTDDILPLVRLILADAAIRTARKISVLPPRTAEQLQIGSATLYRKLKNWGSIGGKGANRS